MFSMFAFVLATALPSWALVLIIIAVLLVVGSLVYVVFRWGENKKTITNTALSGATAIFSVLQNVFHDSPDELDAHDFMKALNALSNAGLDALKEKEQGLSFDDLKDNMKIRVREVVDSFHQIKDDITEEHIDKAVDAFFMVVGYIPKVRDISKK
ncbi:MAG: hypothetical protein KAS32_10305 [Candidatus Peribacteraceae bacterium]|nr:hypothetical protein [Candidatus Peribacteraceae bacterium]